MVRLCLVLAVLVAVHADVLVEVPPDQYKELVTGSQTSDGVEIPDFHWVTSTMPSDDFYASAWIKTLLGTSDANDYFFFSESGNPLLSTWWDTTADASLKSNGALVLQVIIGNRQDNQWYHMVAGTNQGNTYLVITLRDVTNYQYLNDATSTISLTSTSTFNAPRIGPTSSFLVRHM